MKRSRVPIIFVIVSMMAALALMLSNQHKTANRSEARSSKTEKSRSSAADDQSFAPPNVDKNSKDSELNAHLVKIDENGTRVYMIDGSQVTVTKDGDLLFLPEKI